MRALKIFLPILILSLMVIGCGQKAGEIKLNTGSVTLKAAGATSKLTATVYDTGGQVITKLKQPVSWTTSNAGVATVDGSGTVKATGSGVATVTASVAGLTSSAKVNVQIVSSVQVKPNSHSMKAGDTHFFVAVVKDEKGQNIDIPVTWKVGNVKVASVNSKGKVKASEAGKTVVKAVAGGKMGKASLTVIDFKEKDSKVGGLKKDVKKKKAAGLKKKKK